LGRRSRARKPSAARPPAAATPPAAPPPPDRYARSRARNDAIREDLEPLDQGERPGAVTVGAVVCALLGLANIALFAGGVKVHGTKPSVTGVAAFTVLMLACGYGMLRARYWAVLGFEALLGVTIVIAALSLAVASNVSALLLCLAIVGLGGWLFWKLVRAMARIQMPERKPSR
jgi:hypothetical protein